MNTSRLAAVCFGTASLLVTLSPSVLAMTSFQDVPDDAWFASYVQEGVDAGLVSGYKGSDGTLTGFFGPANPVTGAEALKMVTQAAGYLPEQFPQIQWDSECTHWVCPYLPIASYKAIGDFFGIEGLGDLHRFDEPITRAHLAGMIGQAFTFDIINTLDQRYFPPNPYSDIPNVDPGFMIDEYNSAILKLTEDHVISGDTDASGKPLGIFRPDDKLNRAEALKMILGAKRVYGKPKESPTVIDCVPVDTLTNEQPSNPCCEGLKFSPQGNGMGLCEAVSE